MALTPSARWGTVSYYTLTPKLIGTTLLYSAQPLNYGGVPAGATASRDVMPTGNAINSEPGKFYFTGCSDIFGTTNRGATGSANQFNARLDPASIRVLPDPGAS